MAVEPDIDCLLRPLEADADLFAPQSRRKVEFPDIAAYGIVVPVDLGRAEARVSVPGIEGVDVLDLSEALQLHVARHLDEAKAGEIEILPPERRRTQSRGPAPGKTPQPVQGLAQGSNAVFRFGGGGIADMVGVSVQTVYLEHSGVSQPADISLHNEISLSSRFLYYTTIGRRRKEEL